MCCVCVGGGGGGGGKGGWGGRGAWGGGRGGEGRVLVMRCFSNSRTSFFGSVVGGRGAVCQGLARR